MDRFRIMLLLLWWLLLIYINGNGNGNGNGCRAQQTYVDNRQLDCDNNYTTALGYTCQAGTSSSCASYLTFRSQPPLYNTPSSIASLLRSDPTDITSLNNFSSNSATIPANTLIIVPIRNCSCSPAGFYQHNASYVLTSTNQTYFALANNTYEGLTTCQAMISQNPFNYRQLDLGMNLTIPLRCACPSANQTAAGIRYLLTYLITWGNDIPTIAATFGSDAQTVRDANQLSPDHIIYPFTPILVPLTTQPTRINASALPTPPPSPPELPAVPVGGGSSSSKWVFVGVGIGVGFLALISLSGFLVWFFRFRRSKTQNLPPPKPSPSTDYTALTVPPDSNSWSVSSEGVRFAIESLTVYKYNELDKATGSFSEENRVKGSVYRGCFNGDFAAVKMMEGDVSNEINILKQINHSNIIRLSGFCLHQGNTYLVYEFADNGSLSDWLHLKNMNNSDYGSVLGWKQRVQIAHDIADALNYLHNFVSPPYIHKNLKSSNVLLDGQMRAKITNFGLARRVNEDGDGDGTLQLTRHVVGTYGYMPPEYIENGLITPKMDVFALGVLMLELLSGKEAASRPPPHDGSDHEKEEEEKTMVITQQVQLSGMIKDIIGGENVREKLVGFMDGKLRGEYPLDLAYSMAELTSKCVAADLNARPSVTEVFVTLSKIMSSSSDWDPSDELEHSRSLTHGR